MLRLFRQTLLRPRLYSVTENIIQRACAAILREKTQKEEKQHLNKNIMNI